MKKTTIVFLLATLFLIIVSASILALSIEAAENGIPAPSKDGKWLQVCCGPGCAGGYDYCAGTGPYICCK